MNDEFSAVDNPPTSEKKYGLTVSHGPKYLELMQKHGKIKQAEYGTYKYRIVFKPKEGKHPYRKSAGAVCLITDRLVPLGSAYCSYLDGLYLIHFNKYALDIPWRNKDGWKSYWQDDFNGDERYLKSGVFINTDSEKVPGLVRKAVRHIIKLTEIELAEKLPKPQQVEL